MKFMIRLRFLASAALAFVLAIKAPTFVLIAVIVSTLYPFTKDVSKYKNDKESNYLKKFYNWNLHTSYRH